MEIISSALSTLYQSPRAIGLGIITIPLALYTIRKLLLPKPISGIPYNAEAANSLLGDFPAILREAPGSPHTWITQQTSRHNSPIAQVFLIPFGPPSLIISDFRESQDIMMRRKEFDRSSLIIGTIGGEAPLFHANMTTGPAWKAHRKLLQDLMSPEFLHSVAAPNICKSSSRLMRLWSQKLDIVGTVPFVAKEDLFYTALDAIYDFGYGDAAVERALIPQLEMMDGLTEAEKDVIRDGGNGETGIEFPTAAIPASMGAILKSANNVVPPPALACPALAWWIMGLRPSVRKMRAARNTFIKDQVLKSAAKLEQQSDRDAGDAGIKSAIDHIMERERSFAASSGREPIYWSDAIRDEIFGFVAAGHDTTSTALCWGVKFLADNMSVQKRLRKELRTTHASAFAEDRPPSEAEITSSHIPYLDAVVEEIARLSHIVPMQERENTQDTVILGHHIPKGTYVFLANKGAGFTEPAIAVEESRRSPSSQAALREGRTTVLSEHEEVNMNDFRPERWLVVGDDGKEVFDIAAWPALAFGLGRRGCFGRKLAHLELRIIVTLMVWEFELLECPESLSSYDDVQVKLREPRQCYVSLRRPHSIIP